MALVAHVFGKAGCGKCALLKRRLSDILALPEYSGIGMEYHDVLTLPGIVEFCKSGCLNPNRIPALLMARDGEWVDSGMRLDSKGVFNPYVTYPFIGVQTDYDGGGVIRPDDIKDVLRQALEASK